MNEQQKTLSQRLQEAREDIRFQAQLSRCAGQPAIAEGPTGRIAGFMLGNTFYGFKRLPPEKS